MKVLVIEDDVLSTTEIKTFLKMKNYDVVSTDCSDTFSLIFSEIDLYIFDVNFRSLNVINLLKFIRSTDIETPIIIITVSLEIFDLVSSFEFSCADFLTIPFHLKELEVRIKMLLKNNYELVTFENNFIYNTFEDRFYFNKEVLELRKKEKRLLKLLIKSINRVVTTDTIVDYVWEMEIKQEYTLRQLVNCTRKKLPVDIIRTHNGIGYEVRNIS